jgi:hypothetical protein
LRPRNVTRFDGAAAKSDCDRTQRRHEPNDHQQFEQRKSAHARLCPNASASPLR